jgi:hypothetical protein
MQKLAIPLISFNLEKDLGEVIAVLHLLKIPYF